jgi:hypothetical protein
MEWRRIKRILGIAAIAVGASWAQTANPVVVAPEQDAQRTRMELEGWLRRYPPTVARVLALDPSLLGNAPYLEPYPGLTRFLREHPEVARNPGFYIGQGSAIREREPEAQVTERVLDGLGGFLGFGMVMGLLVWLIRTLVDYKRWSRLAKVQTEAHTKILDRFTANEDLLAYIQTPAGARFLESSPIRLDAGPRSVAAPLGRILWSVQGGVVLMAGGLGMQYVSGRLPSGLAEPLRTLGVLGIAIGIGFLVSSAVSYLISKRLGLIESPTQ